MEILRYVNEKQHSKKHYRIMNMQNGNLNGGLAINR